MPDKAHWTGLIRDAQAHEHDTWKRATLDLARQGQEWGDDEVAALLAEGFNPVWDIVDALKKS